MSEDLPKSTMYNPLLDTSQVIDSIVFGPNISRRLNRVLGVNVLPLGRVICTFRCIYCPLASVLTRISSWNEVDKYSWCSVDKITKSLAKAIEILDKVLLDSIVVIGNGEPTLHPEFDKVMREIRRIVDSLSPGVKLAIFTNSSLLDNANVIRGLAEADYVVAKLDAVTEELRTIINRPHEGIAPLAEIIRGLSVLRRELSDRNSNLIISVTLTRTPLGSTNMERSHLQKLSKTLEELNPDQVHLEVPPLPYATVVLPRRSEVVRIAMFLSETLGKDRVFILTGTTTPIPVSLLKKALPDEKHLYREEEVKISDELRILLVESPGAKTRVSILETLLGRRLSCNSIAKTLGLSWWAVQRHLDLLQENELIRPVKFGKRTLYTITPTGLAVLETLKLASSKESITLKLL